MSTHIPTIQLSDGNKIPAIGLGTLEIHQSDAVELLVNAVKAAVRSGYRHFDCAYIYKNEQHIGRAIREAIAESNGTLKREDFFIVSKLWNTFHAKEEVPVAMDETLARFGLDYLDLFLIHWPMGWQVADKSVDRVYDENGFVVGNDIHYIETYLAMEELVRQGKTRSIGLSNFNIEQTRKILKVCTIRPVCSQFEVHPMLQCHDMVEFCQKENIVPVAFAPLGAPNRTWIKDAPVPLESPMVAELAKKYNRQPAQILLRWLVQRGIVPVPKSTTPSRIAENAQIFDFSLTQDEMDSFRTTFKEQFRFYNFESDKKHQFYPF